jgi:hypothetical protein
MRPMNMDGLTIHQEQLQHLQHIANRSNSNPTTGTTARIRKAITHTLKVARAVG